MQVVRKARVARVKVVSDVSASKAITLVVVLTTAATPLNVETSRRRQRQCSRARRVSFGCWAQTVSLNVDESQSDSATVLRLKLSMEI